MYIFNILGQQRTQISHFYSDGSICDKNGLPRQTEVKLKCLENSSSPAQVSLFMLEPKTCQYVLGVESPLICDIIQLADDDGLIDMSLIGKTSEPITTTTVPPPKNKENEIKEQELEKERERLRREREWERLDLHAEGDTYSKTVKVRHNFKKKDGEEDEFDSILD